MSHFLSVRRWLFFIWCNGEVKNVANGVTLDVSARITGYEASLKEMQQMIAKIDPGSEIGKKLSKAFENASK